MSEPIPRERYVQEAIRRARRSQAHPRHDRRDALIQGMGITVGCALVGLWLGPATIEPLVNALGPYRAALVLAVGMTIAAVGVLKWLNRP